MSHILRNSLYTLYQGQPEILELFEQVDLTTLNHKFNAELSKRISKEDAKLAEAMVMSDIVLRYQLAVQEACYASTNAIADLIDFVLMEKTGKES